LLFYPAATPSLIAGIFFHLPCHPLNKTGGNEGGWLADSKDCGGIKTLFFSFS
jgi:hypothetical protein